MPRGLADFRSLSALANFAADTIFMDCVIFWMFLTDFSRMAMSFKFGILVYLSDGIWKIRCLKLPSQLQKWLQ